MSQVQAFEDGLRATLESTPSLSRRGKRLLNLLNSWPSALRTHRIERLERHARVEVEKGGKKIDWSKID